MGKIVIVIHGVGSRGRRETGGNEKSPQGYDEDNASLDKFGKIKGKTRTRETRNTSVGQLQERVGGEGGHNIHDFTTQGARVRH